MTAYPRDWTFVPVSGLRKGMFDIAYLTVRELLLSSFTVT